MSKVILGGLMTLALFLSTSTAKAGDYDQDDYNQDYCKPSYKLVLKKVVTYKTEICYVTKTESYTKCVTLYDHCGKPYSAYKTCYRDVEVPVKKYVPCVNYVKCWVKVCH